MALLDCVLNCVSTIYCKRTKLSRWHIAPLTTSSRHINCNSILLVLRSLLLLSHLLHACEHFAALLAPAPSGHLHGAVLAINGTVARLRLIGYRVLFTYPAGVARRCRRLCRFCLGLDAAICDCHGWHDGYCVGISNFLWLLASLQSVCLLSYAFLFCVLLYLRPTATIESYFSLTIGVLVDCLIALDSSWFFLMFPSFVRKILRMNGIRAGFHSYFFTTRNITQSRPSQSATSTRDHSVSGEKSGVGESHPPGQYLLSELPPS